MDYYVTLFTILIASLGQDSHFGLKEACTKCFGAETVAAAKGPVPGSKQSGSIFSVFAKMNQMPVQVSTHPLSPDEFR